MPERCELPAGFSCIDYEVTTKGVNLNMANYLGTAIRIDEISVISGNLICTSKFNKELENEDVFTFIIDNNGKGCKTGIENQIFIGDIKITYLLKETNIQHKDYGSIAGMIQ